MLHRVASTLVAAPRDIENRELFDDEHPKRNPAIEIDRLARAGLERGARLLDPAHRASGGSTLATQMEKFRHSHEGRTESVGEKLRQILAASMRSYQNCEDTRVRRKEIVLDYLNAVPLGGRPPWGEVLGLGDGLRAWNGDSVCHQRAAGPRTEDAGTYLAPARCGAARRKRKATERPKRSRVE